MKKFIILIVVILISVSVGIFGALTVLPIVSPSLADQFAQDTNNKEETTEHPLKEDPITESENTEDPAEKILSGNFEDYAGIYRNDNGEITLQPNGMLTFEGDNDALTDTVSDIIREPEGYYSWSITTEMDGVGVCLYPVGIDVIAYDGSVVPSDTSKVRLWSGNGDICSNEFIYYKEQN